MNQRGYMLISLLILMPLLLSCFALIAMGFLLFKGDSVTRHACRTELLKAQAQIAEDLEKLLALNTRATALRIKRRNAEIAVSMAPDPVSKAGAVAYLQIVLAEQSAFALRQQNLVLHARALSRTAPLETRARIAEAARKAAGQPISLTLRTNAATFPLIAHPRGSLTPEYWPSTTFSTDQTMSVNWSYPIAGFFPAWLAKQISPVRWDQLTVAASCSATIEKESKKWRTQLNKIVRAKSWSNSW